MTDLDKFSYHEAIDRSHVVNDHFHEYVENHPVIQFHPELKKEASKITSELYRFYNAVSFFADKIHNNESNKENNKENNNGY